MLSALVIMSVGLVEIGFPRIVAERLFPARKTTFDTEIRRARVAHGVEAKDAPDPCGIAKLTAQMAHFGGSMLPAKGHPTEVVPAHMKESGFRNVRANALSARHLTGVDRRIFLGEWVRGKTKMQISAWTFEDSSRSARWMQAKNRESLPRFQNERYRMGRPKHSFE